MEWKERCDNMAEWETEEMRLLRRAVFMQSTEWTQPHEGWSLDSLGWKNKAGAFCDCRDDVDGKGCFENSDEVPFEFFRTYILSSLLSAASFLQQSS
jgi:hypothetical protein